METLKTAFVILNTSYFIGLGWYTICMLEQDLLLGDPLIENPHERNFIGYYDWTNDNKTPEEVAMGVAYFAFTSLSTVGFGDLTPRSDLERVIGAILLLVGVALFTYIMGLFIEMLDELSLVQANYEDGDNLTKFFGAL